MLTRIVDCQKMAVNLTDSRQFSSENVYRHGQQFRLTDLHPPGYNIIIYLGSCFIGAKKPNQNIYNFSLQQLFTEHDMHMLILTRNNPPLPSSLPTTSPPLPLPPSPHSRLVMTLETMVLV